MTATTNSKGLSGTDYEVLNVLRNGITSPSEIARRIIVCAPELLAALEETWKFACGSCRWDRSSKGCNNDCHNLKYKQLIAKAKGEE